MQNRDFNEKWLKAFGKTLTEVQKDKGSIGRDGGFLWHAFSYGYIFCLDGDVARDAYDKANKTRAKLAFYRRTDKINGNEQYTICEQTLVTEDFITAEQIDESTEIEIYVMGDNCDWCYIRTHETTCGPYFCVKSNIKTLAGSQGGCP